MSQESSSTLRFSLEESVWFQKGQEVAELLSISLDPNITIQENDQYITIQGSLELSGEYKRNNEEEQEEDVFKAPKLIHSVMEREENVCEFLHHFPVDITIPLSRVANLNDLEIEVETFDYVFPETSCLNLTADLSISGLVEAEQEVREEEVLQAIEETKPLEPIEEIELAFRGPVQTEIELEPGEYEEPEEITFSTLQNSSSLLEDKDEETTEDLYKSFEVEVRKAPEEEDEWNSKDSAYFAEAREEIEEVASVPEMKVSLFRSEEEVYSAEEVFQKPPQESSSISKTEEILLGHQEELEESSSAPTEEPKKKKGLFSKTKSLTFTEFFARKEEETHTKLKVCIVQHGDTLEKLSNRYNVNIHNLLKENRLEANQDIYEGQVLYIPGSFVEK